MLEKGLLDAPEGGSNDSFHRVGCMFSTYFTDRKVMDFAAAKTSDTAAFSRFFAGMLQKGVNIAPSQFEAGFMSLAHTRADINKTIDAARKSLKDL